MQPSNNSVADTVRLPVHRPELEPPLVDAAGAGGSGAGDSGAGDPAGPDRDRVRLDATKLWTGGLATAAVTALIALVGVLIIQVLARVVPHIADTPITHGTGTALLCITAATAALTATGLAHLLVTSTPRPIAYLGWIIGLTTAAATVLPLATPLPLTAAAAHAVLNLITGLAIGSLVTGATIAAVRSGRTAD